MSKQTHPIKNQFMTRLKELGKKGASSAALLMAAFLGLIMFSMAVVTFWGARTSHSPSYFQGKTIRSALVVEPKTTAQLTKLFQEKSFDLALVQEGRKPSPRLILMRIPADLPAQIPAEIRKETFLKILLPAILLANEEILFIRGRVQRLERRSAAGLALSTRQIDWLIGIARKFGVSEEGLSDDGLFYPRLLERVDTIPVDLALAQGGIESGWGTSRVALEGNAIFGQRTWDRGNEVAADPEIKTLYRAYDNILEATRSYALNLNTHEAYDGFRKRRMEMRKAGKPIDAASLAGKLLRYSERGQDYVDQIRTVIAVNKLTDFSQARLAPD